MRPCATSTLELWNGYWWRWIFNSEGQAVAFVRLQAVT